MTRHDKAGSGRSRQPQILVVEDEASIRHLLRTTLEIDGYVVHEAGTVAEGVAIAGSRPIDLYIVDLGLPDGEGLQLIRAVRRWSARPIIILSARSLEAEKVRALDAGANDYVTKPFGLSELHARVRACLRHAAQTRMNGATTLVAGQIEIDLESRIVRRGGEPVRLTATQWRLLEVLARHVGSVVTSHQLLREVWGLDHVEQAHYLRVYMRQLRLKLEDDPANPVLLVTETGVGYRMVCTAFGE